jgi:conjugative relaxase-like TrwC/TraI family protein
MLTISKPLSAGQAQSYHAEEFSNARENYYTEADQIRGEWHGRLAERWGLHGEVREEHFQRLSEGQHPITGEQQIRRQAAREYMNRRGEKVSAMKHRAGWDATFSAPKSVSLTALVGGDERVREAHQESVAIALDELERYVQARIGGNLPAETTGKWVAAKFEHDSARPVDGYAAPQLHTHVVFFNLTETEDGEAHAFQPRELYKSQQYATAVYRSELAHRLKELGYEIERGESSQPEIKGYSKEYLEASSPRRRQIEEHLAKHDQRGAGAAQIAAHQTREEKLELSHEAMMERHRAVAEAFSNQPERVVEAAKERREQLKEEPRERTISQALTYSREKNLEREAVAEERELLRDALKRSMGDATVAEVKAEFEKRVQAGEFIETSNRGPGRAFTTEEMIDCERDTIQLMRTGQNQHAPIASFKTRRGIEHDHSHLSESQRAAVVQILSSRDQVTALEGVAGAGKTTSLAVIREAAEHDGYKVGGFAPTSRAAQKLGEARIESSTLQRHLARSQEPYDGQKRLYVLDESSLASTKQMNEFLHRLKENDRVLLVGDTRQHEAVEAGRPYHQLQEAGIATARLDEIVRQKDPTLRDVVEKLSRGQVKEAIEKLDAQGRVHEIFDRDERMASIAHEYVKQPEGTLVVSPDNQSRMEINRTIHYAMQDAGKMPYREHEMTVLVARQEITRADRQWAAISTWRRGALHERQQDARHRGWRVRPRRAHE